MPQMAPLNWLSLMMFFLFIYIFFNIMNYYSFIYKLMPKKSKSLKKNLINWKW